MDAMLNGCTQWMKLHCAGTDLDLYSHLLKIWYKGNIYWFIEIWKEEKELRKWEEAGEKKVQMELGFESVRVHQMRIMAMKVMSNMILAEWAHVIRRQKDKWRIWKRVFHVMFTLWNQESGGSVSRRMEKKKERKKEGNIEGGAIPMYQGMTLTTTSMINWISSFLWNQSQGINWWECKEFRLIPFVLLIEMFFLCPSLISLLK